MHFFRISRSFVILAQPSPASTSAMRYYAPPSSLSLLLTNCLLNRSGRLHDLPVTSRSRSFRLTSISFSLRGYGTCCQPTPPSVARQYPFFVQLTQDFWCHFISCPAALVTSVQRLRHPPQHDARPKFSCLRRRSLSTQLRRLHRLQICAPKFGSCPSWRYPHHVKHALPCSIVPPRRSTSLPARQGRNQE